MCGYRCEVAGGWGVNKSTDVWIQVRGGWGLGGQQLHRCVDTGARWLGAGAGLGSSRPLVCGYRWGGWGLGQRAQGWGQQATGVWCVAGVWWM